MRIRIQDPKKVNPDPIQGDTKEEKLHQKFSNKSFKMTVKKSLKTNKQNIFTVSNTKGSRSNFKSASALAKKPRLRNSVEKCT